MLRASRRQLCFDDIPKPVGWGGRRRGAGRRTAPRARVLHRARPAWSSACPSHVTLGLRHGVPSLRSRRFVDAFQASLRTSCERGDFRVVHYSLQRDHIHLLVEADSKDALSRGMKSVAARLARAVNRVFRRKGDVLDGRYHLRLLRSPREVRAGLAYVLLNARRHWMKRFGSAPPVRIDEASSGQWFDGWGKPVTRPRKDDSEVAPARTWLVRLGWRRHGLIDPSEIPGRKRRGS